MNPALTRDVVREAAQAAGVCVRPVVARVMDSESGEVRMVPIACGTTRESRCRPCAERARRLRMHQCREGWHLDHEPERQRDLPDVAAAEGWSDLPGVWEPLAGDDDEDQGDERQRERRRVRSTRRRQDVPDLPTVPVEDRTVGQVFEAPDGKTYRPSMFLTLTLPSYGKVDGEGVPVDPASYDYRRAALDALHFGKLLDRFWQNLRRCVGFKVQYFAAVEAQRRGAPHLHAAARGCFPRRVVREVVAATYHQVWWPAHDEPVYDRRPPRWSDETGGYVDPATGEGLTTWDEAMDRLDADASARPAHVVRFGTQLDMQGVLAGTPKAGRAIGYLAKYLTKDLAGTYDDEDVSDRRAAHLDRLAEEARCLPCSERCANWLRYGIQPADAGPGMVPGQCKARAHDRENLGYGGRRVLVSRRWTGKTLAGHRADRAAVVRAALEEAGVDPDDHDQFAISGSDGRWCWEVIGRARIDDRTYTQAIAEAVATRQRWRRQYETARQRAGPMRPAPVMTGPAAQFGNSATTGRERTR